MTTTMQTARFMKSNPLCPARRHSPNMEAYRRGCRCAPALLFIETWARERAVVPCRAGRHTASHDSWRKGCRCAGTLVAHEEWKMRLRVERNTALAYHKATGMCGAPVHLTLGAYRRGCRCADAVAAYEVKFAERAQRARDKWQTTPGNPWRDGRMKVDRTNLFMLVHGLIDRPTMGERLAAFVILSQRGNEVTGRLTSLEIAARIGVEIKLMSTYRKKIQQLREERTLRRLTDVRDKARRVAAAPERRRKAAEDAARGSARRAAAARRCRPRVQSRERARALAASLDGPVTR